MKSCPVCNKKVIGRTDKIFCSPNCKAVYHQKLNKATNKATSHVDKILHRNRSILYEIMGDKNKLKIEKYLLDNKNFNYSYCTGIQFSKNNRMYRKVYDFSWMEFSDGKIWIVRNKEESLLR